MGSSAQSMSHARMQVQCRCQCSWYFAVPVDVPKQHAVNITAVISIEARGDQPQGSHGSHIENITTTGLQSGSWGCL
jgi:hypothetical protein